MLLSWTALLGLCLLGAYADVPTPEEIFMGQELVQAVYRESERMRKEEMPGMPRVSGQSEVCYPEIGCFSKEDGPFSFTTTMPETPEQIGTTFSLFAAKNPKDSKPLSYLDKSTLETDILDPSLPLAVISHGLNENGGKPWIANLKSALFAKGYGNVIVVDWSKGAILPFYGQAMVNSEVVGRQLAYILELLHQRRGVSLDTTHLFGYSLGAHLSGFAGKSILFKLGQRIGRITGLDPAGPTFENKTPKTHLSYLDATYVDIVHTSAGTSGILMGDLGIVKAIGHVDFYPNGGKDQPGCGLFDVTCSHRRGNELFLESMSSDCVFTSFPCAGGYQDYKAGKCKDCEATGCGALGFHSHRHIGRGSLYLHTNKYAPYCVPSL